MRLSTKFGLFLLVLAIVLSLGLFAATDASREQSIDRERAQVNDTAGTIASVIENDLRRARATQASAALQAESLASMDIGPLVTGPEVVGAHLVAANGTVLKATGRTNALGEARVGSNVGNETYVQEALQSKTYVSRAVWLADRERYAMVVAAPIVDNGSVTGVVATTRYVDARHAVVADRADVYIANTSREPTVSSGARAGVPDEIQGTATVKSTGWTIHVTRDTTSLQDRLDNLVLIQAVGVVGVLLLVGGFAFLVYWEVIRQIRRLEDGFDALQAGQYDSTLALSGSDEWQAIGRGYDHLTGELKSRERGIRQREERLMVLNRALRHNIRNSITALVGYFEVIERKTESAAVAERATRGADRAMEVSALSNKAREIESVLESAEGGLETRDLVSVTEVAIAEVQRRYHNATIHTELPSTAPVRAVPKIRPAIVDLIENGIKHNPAEAPAVEVTIEPGPDWTSLVVSDDGPGLPENERSVIESHQETPLDHGSGLGLWLINWSVEKSNGEIRIETEEGAGTTVELRFRSATDVQSM